MSIHELRDVVVLVDGVERTWRLEVRSWPEAPRWRLTLHDGAGRSWTGEEWEQFEALRELRRRLDADSILIAVEGARPNSWASGMQRDMGGGTVCYQLAVPRSRARPPQARTLDPAPVGDVGTVADQDAFQARWRADLDLPTES